VRSYTRHKLKQDAFAAQTADTINWAVDNRTPLIVVGVIVAVLLAGAIGGWAYINYRDQQAKGDLALAIQKYNAPLRQPGTPASADVMSFASPQERAKAANTDFNRLADKYNFTQSGRIARYFAGVSAHELGDNATAETQLKDVADSHYKEIASLAKIALASLYHQTNRDPQAIALYKDLEDHPTDSAGKTSVQFLLASLYEDSGQQQEARRIYEQMAKENPGTQIAMMASQRIQALK
jgi:predicted negative regulator of RcsB-dependent stress response